MKHPFFSVQLRLFVLLIAVCILATDTFVYAREQQALDEPSPIQQALSEIDSSPAPAATPSPTKKPAQSAEKFSSRVIKFTHQKNFNSEHITAAQTSFAGAAVPTSINEVSLYTLSYEIQGKDGSWQPTTAKVFVPKNGTNYPLFVFGSGTTGMADKCAPSLENMAVENLGNYQNHMIAQAAAGYVTIFPDYEGFHNASKTQAYFISESEAKVLLGSIKGVREMQSAEPALAVADLNSVFLAGYSQGGHAALSTAQQWKQLPEEVKLKGIIQFAGAADVHALFIESPWLASYLVESYREYYGVELDNREVLQDRWLTEQRKNNDELCVNAAYKFYPRERAKIYTPSFVDAIETNTWPARLAPWREAIMTNTPLTGIPDVPQLSIQGETDPIVTAKAQRANLKQLCQENKRVAYTEYPGVNHFQIRQVSFHETNEWMRDVLAGQPAPSDCP